MNLADESKVTSGLETCFTDTRMFSHQLEDYFRSEMFGDAYFGYATDKSCPINYANKFESLLLLQFLWNHSIFLKTIANK